MFNFKYKNIEVVHNNFFKELKVINSQYEIIYFIEGESVQTIDYQSKKLVKGDLLVIKPGSIHVLLGNFKAYILKFSNSFLSQEIEQTLNRIPSFAGNYKFLETVFLDFDRIYANYPKEFVYELMINNIKKIIIEVNLSSQKTRDIITDYMIKNIINYIQTNINKEINITNLCLNLHFSKSHICNEFSQRLGISLKKYIRILKIINIDNYMKKTQISIGKLVESYGFKNYSTFYRNYLSFIGKSPLKGKSKH